MVLSAAHEPTAQPSRRALLALAAVIGLATSTAGFSQPASRGAPSPAEALVREALSTNPKLHAQAQRVEAARQRVPQASALPDPMADLRLTNISLSDPNLHDALTTGLELGIEQTLPGPGKRALAKEVANREVAAESARYLALERDVRRQVLDASYQYGLLQTLLKINEETAQAQRVVIDAALASYSSGSGSQTDVLLAQSTLTKIGAERTDLASQREIARARLSNLLARPVSLSELEGLLPADEPAALPALDGLLSSLPEGSAEVLRARAESAVAGQRVAVAKKASAPDFLVGGAYRYKDMSMGGNNYLTATVGITLPFFHRSDRYLPAQNEALALHRGAMEEERSALDEARFELSTAHRRASRDVELYRLYRDGLLVQASQAYSAALSSYSTGRTGMVAVLNALALLYGSQAQLATTSADYYQNVAAAEALVGRSLEDFPSTAGAVVPAADPKTPVQKEKE
jgi:outer membrane protein, heavy metal efflux system